MAGDGASATGPAGLPASRTPQAVVVAGLLITFIGLAAVTAVLPAGLALSAAAFGLLAVGVVGLFAGGSLLGFAVAANRTGRPRR